MPDARITSLENEVAALRAELKESRDALAAIHAGAVDALVVLPKEGGAKIFTREGSDFPFRAFVEQMHEGAVTLDASGQIIYANKRMAALFNQPLEAILNKPFHRFFMSPDDEWVCEILNRSHACGKPGKSGTLLAEFEGVPIPVSISCQPFDVRGMPCLSVIVTDMTEHLALARAEVRQESLDALRASENRYRDLVNFSPEPIAVHAEGKWIFGNQAALDLFGAKSPEEFIGHSVIEQIDKSDRVAAELRIQSLITQEKKATPVKPTQMVRLDGSRIDVELTGIAIDFEGRPAILVVLRDITERKLAEDALRESETRFKLALWNSPVSVAIQDRDLIFRWAYNQKQQPSDDIVGKTDADFFAPEDAAWLKDLKQQVLEGGAEIHVENWMTCQGKRVFLDLHFQPMKNAEGETTGIGIATVDLTEKKKLENLLRESEERYRLLAETMLHGVIHQKDDGTVLAMNPAAEQILGLSSRSTVGTLMILGGDGSVREDGQPFPETEDPASVAFRTGQPVRGVIMGITNPHEKARRWIMVDAVPLFRPKLDTVWEVYTIFNDFTERRQAQEALRRNEAILRTIMDNAQDGIYLKDRESRLVYINPAGLALEGRSAQSLVGRSAMEVYSDPALADAIMTNDRRVMESQEPVTFEERIRTRDGWRIIQSAKIAWRDQDGQVKGTLGISRDITAQKRAEEELKKSEERYRTLFNRMLEGFCVIEVMFGDDDEPFDCRLIEANPAFEIHTGLHDIKGRTITELNPEVDPFWCKTFGKVVVTGEPVRFEREVKILNRCYEVSAVRVGDPADNRVAILFSDITERKKASELLEQRVTDRTEDLNQAVQTLRMIMSCHQAMVRVQDEMELIRQICRIIRVMGGYLMAWVGYAEKDEAKTVRPVYWDGEGQEYLAKARITWADEPRGNCVTGSCIRLREVRLSRDLLQESGRISNEEFALQFGFRSCLALPLGWEGQVFGALTIYSDRPDGFSQDRVALLAELAQDMAFGISVIRSRCERDQARALAEHRAGLLRTLAAELVLAEQKERRKLVKILHDHVQQLLVAAKYGIVGLIGKLPEESARNACLKVEDTLDQAIQASRSLSIELSPPVLHEKGLFAAVKWLGRQMLERHGLVVEVVSEKEEYDLAPQYNSFLFDAIRELLFNIVKHAGVKRAYVHLEALHDGFQVIVRDEGVGFDASQIGQSKTNGSGLGLFSIRERLGYLGGQFLVESTAGKGSQFTLITPFGLIPSAASPVSETIEEYPQSLTVAAPARHHPLDHRTIRVLLADDHQVVRQGLAGLIENEPDLEVVGEASDGEEAVALARKFQPDVVVMDISMPKMDGLEATKVICRDLPGISVIGLSMHEDPAIVKAIREGGALGFVTKGGGSGELLSTIRSVARAS